MGEKVRVLWLIKGLGAGGAEQLLVNALPHLDRERFEYHVAYILPWKDHNVGNFQVHNVPVFCLEGGNPLDFRVVARLRRLLRDQRIDVLDAHLAYSGVVGRIAARWAGTRAVMYTEHNLAVQRRLSSFQFVTFLANVATMGWNDLVVTISREGFADVNRFVRGRVPVRMIYNGIPLDRFDREKARPDREALSIPRHHLVVGHLATFTSKKKQDDLLRAAKVVLDQEPEVTFVLVGTGDLLPELERLTDELGIRDSVLFPGYLNNAQDVLACFDVFVLSSQYEGLPTVVIEAMAMGVPVVATRVGGTAEIVDDGTDGLLVPPCDPQALAESLLRLLRDEELRVRMGTQAVQSVRARFAIERRVREVEQAYEAMLAGALSSSRVQQPKRPASNVRSRLRTFRRRK